MSNPIGGSCVEMSIGNRTYQMAADADLDVFVGGYEPEVRPNGGGGGRKVMPRTNWSAENCKVEVDDVLGDQEALQESANRPVFEDITFTFPGNVVWEGRGTIVGKVSRSTEDATATFNVEGIGQLRRQG